MSSRLHGDDDDTQEEGLLARLREPLIVVSSSSSSSSEQRQQNRRRPNDGEEDRSDNDDDQQDSSCCRSSLSTPSTSTSSLILTWKEEIKLFLGLSFPTIWIQLSFNIPGFMVASKIGRLYGYMYLDGFALANLTGNLFTLSLLQGLLSACDTLCPRAYAVGNYKEVGILAARGYVASLLLLIPSSILLASYIESILLYLSISVEAARYAGEWYRIYALGLPFYALFVVLFKYLSAQNNMKPLVIASVTSCLVVLPITLYYLPQWFESLGRTGTSGFQGTAWAIVLHQVFQVTILLLNLIACPRKKMWQQQQQHQQNQPRGTSSCWPGSRIAFQEAVRWNPFVEFVRLGFGGVLASSGWIYWEVIAFMVGSKLGALPLSIHTIPTQVLSVLYMVPKGLGIALSVRMSSLLAVNVDRAKQLVRWIVTGSLVLITITTGTVYFFRHTIFRIFSNEYNVLNGAEEVWPDVCVYYLVTAVFGVNMGIAIGMGIQWYQGALLVGFLWLIGLPTTYYFAVTESGGIGAVWCCLWPPFLAVDIIMVAIFASKDWSIVTEAIQQRQQRERGTLPLLRNNDSDTDVVDDLITFGSDRR